MTVDGGRRRSLNLISDVDLDRGRCRKAARLEPDAWLVTVRDAVSQSLWLSHHGLSEKGEGLVDRIPTDRHDDWWSESGLGRWRLLGRPGRSFTFLI